MSMRIICLVTGFIFGSIPNGYLIARSKGVDIRHTGSGNVGTTNVLRSMGKKYGALTLLLDMAKAIVPIIIMQLFYGDVHETRYITTMYTGLGAVLCIAGLGVSAGTGMFRHHHRRKRRADG